MDVSLLNSFNKAGADLALKNKKKEAVESKKSSASFKKQLDKASSGFEAAPGLKGDEELSSLMDELFLNGENLVKDPTLNNLRLYRNSISLFFKYVVKNGLGYDNIEGRLNPKTFERKCYALISVVDEKVDSIAKSILGDQRKQLDLLDAVEEVNGLIIDLIG